MELNRLTFAACVEFVVTNAVYPSGSAFRTASAARLPSAPGLFSTTTVAFVAVRMLSARCLVTLSVALPGGNGTTSVMRWEGKDSADTFEEAAAKSSRIAGPRTALNLMSPSSRYPCRYRTLMYYLWVLAQGISEPSDPPLSLRSLSWNRWPM